MRGLASILTGGNILSLDFFCFHAEKPLMPILAFSSSLSKKPHSFTSSTTCRKKVKTTSSGKSPNLHIVSPDNRH